jgi:hypothetical protein
MGYLTANNAKYAKKAKIFSRKRAQRGKAATKERKE